MLKDGRSCLQAGLILITILIYYLWFFLCSASYFGWCSAESDSAEPTSKSYL